MFDGSEQLRQLLFSSDQLLGLFGGLRAEGPRVEVFDQPKKVKVIIEAPGLSAKNKQWAMRVLDQHLYLRGRLEAEQSVKSDFGSFYSERRSEQFTKVIPLPSPVRRKPSAVEYKDGLITVILEKIGEPAEDEWIKLDVPTKK